MLVLGIDPSLSSTGYAAIDSDTKKIFKKGKINTSPKDSTDERIFKIVTFLNDEFLNVHTIVLEDGYVGFNMRGSLKLAELRGAIIYNFKLRKRKVIYNQPKEIRKNLGLSGAAKKDEVAKAVLFRYPYLKNEIGPYSDKQNKDKTSDIYDAISIALSYINQLEK